LLASLVVPSRKVAPLAPQPKRDAYARHRWPRPANWRSGSRAGRWVPDRAFGVPPGRNPGRTGPLARRWLGTRPGSRGFCGCGAPCGCWARRARAGQHQQSSCTTATTNPWMHRRTLCRRASSHRLPCAVSICRIWRSESSIDQLSKMLDLRVVLLHGHCDLSRRARRAPSTDQGSSATATMTATSATKSRA
jgi:hypothetical protein